MRKRGTPLWVLLYPTPRGSGISLRSVLRGPQRPITNREGCSVACYAPLSDTEAGVATVPGWGRSVLMGWIGGYADDRINAAVVRWDAGSLPSSVDGCSWPWRAVRHSAWVDAQS